MNPIAYKIIADLINAAQEKGSEIIYYLNQMSDHLYNSETPTDNREKSVFYNTLQNSGLSMEGSVKSAFFSYTSN